MDPETIAKAAVTVVTPLAALIGVGGRRRRLRTQIRENVALLEEVKKDAVLRDHTPAPGWLSAQIAVDIARLTGQALGKRKKKPVPWGSVVLAGLLALGFGAWTIYINHRGFAWYSIFPGVTASLFGISVIGMFTNRQLPTDLPDGATPIRSGTAEEQIRTRAQLASSTLSSTGSSETFSAGAVALTFIDLMRSGKYEDALAYADSDWATARIQSRLWNTCVSGNTDLTIEGLPAIVDRLATEHEPAQLWSDYVAAESKQFQEAWSPIDVSRLGIASRRRRLARDYDLVILAPLGDTEGYFVTTATVLQDSMTFLMRRVAGKWLVANHVGTAPPTLGLPPSWWDPSDRTFDELPDA